jgi:catechol 2,3-dioxygenase
MRVHSLGHVVLNVRSVPRSEAFYAGILGIPVISRISDPVRMTFFSLGNHHDFAVVEAGGTAPTPDPGAIGLAHVAFKVGDSCNDLSSVESDLDSAGIPILYTAERTFTKSLHLHDPDGNEVELYVDTSDAWKESVQSATSAPGRR